MRCFIVGRLSYQEVIPQRGYPTGDREFIPQHGYPTENLPMALFPYTARGPHIERLYREDISLGGQDPEDDTVTVVHFMQTADCMFILPWRDQGLDPEILR